MSFYMILLEPVLDDLWPASSKFRSLKEYTLSFRLSAAVLPKIFPLYHFFVPHHQHFIPYFFISRSGYP
jgi:hypothetical protein